MDLLERYAVHSRGARGRDPKKKEPVGTPGTGVTQNRFSVLPVLSFGRTCRDSKLMVSLTRDEVNFLQLMVSLTRDRANFLQLMVSLTRDGVNFLQLMVSLTRDGVNFLQLMPSQIWKGGNFLQLKVAPSHMTFPYLRLTAPQGLPALRKP